jgi:type IV secretion system protein TrbL
LGRDRGGHDLLRSTTEFAADKLAIRREGFLKRYVPLLLLLLVLASVPMVAQSVNGGTIVIVPNGPTISSPSDIVNIYESTVGRWIQVLQGYAFDIFFTLAGLELAWFGIEILLAFRFNFTIAAVMTINKVLKLGIFLSILMNADTWIPAIVNLFPVLGQKASGITSIKPSDVLVTGLTIGASLMKASGKAGLTLDLHVSLALVIGAIGIVLCFIWLTAGFVIAKLETILAIGVGFIFCAFGGWRVTTNFVERYFGFAMASGIKLMTQYMFLGLGMNVAQSWVAQAQNLSFWSLNVDVCWSILGGCLLYALVVWHVSKLASGVMAGQPSLTSSEALGLMGAMVSAAAVGFSAIPSAGASVAAGAGAAAAGAGAGSTGAVAAAGTASAAPAAAAAPSAASFAGSGGGSAAATGGSAGGPAPASAPNLANSLSALGRVMSSAPHGGGGGGGVRLDSVGH